MLKINNSHFALRCVLVIGFSALSAPPALADRPSYSSPEAVYYAFRDASDQGDTQTMVDCLSAAGQNALVRAYIGLIMKTPTTAPTNHLPDPQELKFQAKYGLDQGQRKSGESDDAFAERLTAGVKDKRAFVIDLLVPAPGATTRPAADHPVKLLKKMQIDSSGTTATAQVSLTDPTVLEIDLNVRFEKVDGSWRIASSMLYGLAMGL